MFHNMFSKSKTKSGMLRTVLRVTKGISSEKVSDYKFDTISSYFIFGFKVAFVINIDVKATKPSKKSFKHV